MEQPKLICRKNGRGKGLSEWHLFLSFTPSPYVTFCHFFCHTPLPSRVTYFLNCPLEKRKFRFRWKKRSLKLSAVDLQHHRFSDDFRGNRSELICSNSLKIVKFDIDPLGELSLLIWTCDNHWRQNRLKFLLIRITVHNLTKNSLEYTSSKVIL